MQDGLDFGDQFRPYQATAIDMVRRYLDEFESLEEQGCAVVCHPTGSGKTAIVGGITQCASETGGALVLTTRKAVRDQLFVELSSNLFVTKFGLGTDIDLPKIVYPILAGRDLERPARKVVDSYIRRLLPQNLHEFAHRQVRRVVTDEVATCIDELEAGRAILISSVQLLETLSRIDRTSAIYDDLRAALRMVLFDEGHYEPARQWSSVIRKLEKPIILFSATPFRNDLRPFVVNPDFFDIYHHNSAINDGVIRSVKVEKRQKVSDARELFEDIKSYCGEKFGGKDNWPRIVICCGDHIRIEEIGERFVNDGFKVAAIHERFDKPGTKRTMSRSPLWQYKDVPAPATTEAEIWIHQRKLLEGIDDNRFRVLAFFDPMRNGREMVQQIGRVLRINPEGEEAGGKEAYVLDHSGGRVEKDWKAFLDYDAHLTKESLFDSMSKQYLRSFLLLHPEIEYVDGTFRRRFDVENFLPVVDEILFKRQVNLLQAGESFSLEAVVQEQIGHLEQKQAVFNKCYCEENCAVIVSLTQRNPEFLNSAFYSEMRHNVRVILYLPDAKVVAVSDALGTGLGPSLSTLKPLQHERLVKALVPAEVGRVVALSSRNTNVSNRVIRSRTVRAPSLVKVAPSVDDHGHVLSTAQGWDSTQYRIVDDLSEFIDDEGFSLREVSDAIREQVAKAVEEDHDPDLIHRYVSVSTGRISESGPQLRLGHYCAWIQSLVDQMESKETGPSSEDVFGRFAASADPPKRPLAENLLLDLYDAEELFRFRINEDDEDGPDRFEGIRFDDLCLNKVRVERDKKRNRVSVFQLVLNGKTFELAVLHNPMSQRYRIDSAELDKRVRPADNESRYLFTRYLNETQSFSVLPEDLSTIYVHGQFYAPGVRHGADFDESKFFAGRCLIPCARLDGISSEKGKVVLADDRTPTAHDGRYYDPDSLFSIIDTWSADVASNLKIDVNGNHSTTPRMIEALVGQISFTPNIVVCDDMGKESADFILANEDLGIVALVHAKATRKRRPYSASAMQEVCAQAQKNANLYSFFSLNLPGNYGSWGQAHRFEGLSVSKRIRKPYAERKDRVWARLRSMLKNPQTTKEIWIVTGNMLSVSDVRKALRSSNAPSEVIQLNHLIETTIASATSLGAKLRIFCMP